MSDMCVLVYKATTVIGVSSSTRAGLHPVVTEPSVSTWSSGRSSASVVAATTASRVNTSTAAPRHPVSTAAHVPTRRPPEATSAHAPPDTSVPRAPSMIHAVREVPGRSVFATAARVLRRRALVAPSCTSVLVGRASTVETVPCSTHAPRHRASTARPVSSWPAYSTRAPARRDTPGGTATDARRAKVVRVGTAPRASKPETVSAAHARQDTTAAPVIKATRVCWQLVHHV